MSTSINETKFTDLKAKLRELFELDKSDLDFGIYRIMAAKNKEVTEFLDHQLKAVVRDTLANHGAGASAQVQAELDKVIAGLKTADMTDDEIAANKKVIDLRSKLDVTGGASTGELEADIYNHLLAFFSRYYDEGDFISRRRYKGDTYAIPYNGEEVTLHWANKDQYYIKSGEWHQDYRFKLPGAAGGKAVRFKLVAATTEVNNNKESDDAKRRYILHEANPVSADAQELVLYFEFRVPTEADRNRAANGAVAIFGGKYAAERGATKGDEREQFCADAEQRALAAMPDTWRAAVTQPAPTEGKPLRTILGKQLEHFTAKNTFDYFIHKDLGGFLRRELDFYLKNEVVRLDDLESLPSDHLQRVQGKVKAIRVVASRVIAFLASVEDFQKKLWLKKKFVLNTHWLVTVDRIPAELRDVVASNPAQWKAWEDLGFKPEKVDATLLASPQWGTRDYLDANDKLVVDTSLFPESEYPGFTANLVASERISGGNTSVEAGVTGVLVHSENFQALNILRERYAGQVQTVYIDPPYNTVHSKIAYKNQFEHASWLSLMQNSFGVVSDFWTDDFSFGLAIDDYESTRLAMLLRVSFPSLEHTTVVVNHHPQGSGGRLSRTHEYLHLLSRPSAPSYLGRPIPDDTEDRSFMRSGTAENNYRHGRPNSFYALLLDPKTHRLVGTEAPPEKDDANYPKGPTAAGYLRIYPINSRGEERVWRSAYETGTARVQRNELFVTTQGSIKQRIDHESKREVLFSNWVGAEFNAGTHGTSVLDDLGLGGIFDYPKSVKQMEVGLWAQSFGNTNSCVLDYFGGSGSTGHAVINLNRADEGEGDRRFILVEMGAYFHTVLKPRITKVLYSPDWKEGKAQTHGKGVSALVKCFALESYDDALNNLPAPMSEFLPGADDSTRAAMLQYALDLQLGPAMLNLDAFADPWNYSINAQPAGEAEIKPMRVDLVETFNYLIGLKVAAYGPIERYDAEFEQAEHADGLGRLKINGRLRKSKAGRFVFQRVEGELLDGTRVLVVWRKLSDQPEQDAAALDAWMARHGEETRQRSTHRDYHLIYINGPVTLPQPTAEIRTVLPLEETFKDKMFADTDADLGGQPNG